MTPRSQSALGFSPASYMTVFATPSRVPRAEKVREAYADWAGLLVEATIQGAYLAEVKASGNPEGELLSRFRELHEKADIVTCKILMLEKRPLLREAFKKLNSEKYPTDPLPDQSKAPDFWRIAASDRDIIGCFHGLVKEIVVAFAEWISNPDEAVPFPMPTNEHYLDFLNTREKVVKAGLHF